MKNIFLVIHLLFSVGYSAVVINADAEYITISDNVKFTFTPVDDERSLSLYYKTTSLPDVNGEYQMLLSLDEAAGNKIQVSIANNAGTNILLCSARDAAYANLGGFYCVLPSVTSNTWYHIVLNLSSDGNCSIYWNGSSQSVTHSSWDDNTEINPSTVLISNGINVDDNFTISYFGWYNDTLSSAEVTSISSNPYYFNDSSNCLLSLPMREDTLTVAYDYQAQSTQTNGTLTGGPTWDSDSAVSVFVDSFFTTTGWWYWDYSLGTGDQSCPVVEDSRTVCEIFVTDESSSATESDGNIHPAVADKPAVFTFTSILKTDSVTAGSWGTGLWNPATSDIIWFMWYGDESQDTVQGFRAQIGGTDTSMHNHLINFPIDTSLWHTYKIVAGTDYCQFFIDDTIVSTYNGNMPDGLIRETIWVNNVAYFGGDSTQRLDLDNGQYVYIDDVFYSPTAEDFDAMYILTLSAEIGGTVSPTPDTIVDSNTAVTVEATAQACSSFAYWETTNGTIGWVDSSLATASCTLHTSCEINAVFYIDTTTLDTTIVGTGTVTTKGSDLIFGCGEIDTIIATPGIDSSVAFSGDTSSTSEDSAFVIMDQNRSVTITFTEDAPGTWTLTMTNDGNGTTSPATDTAVSQGTPANIDNTPSANYHFGYWSISSGAGSFNGDSSQFTPTSSTTLLANFYLDTFYVDTSFSGTGMMYFISADSIYEYGAADCSLYVAMGAGYYVVWPGGYVGSYSDSTYDTLVFTVTEDSIVIATFTAYPTYSISIPDSTNCGLEFSHGPADIDSNTSVTLTITADENYHWVSNDTVNANPFTFTIISDTTLEVSIAIDTYYVDTSYNTGCSLVFLSAVDSIFEYGETCSLRLTVDQDYVCNWPGGSNIGSTSGAVYDTINFTVIENSTVTATGRAWPQYAIDSTVVNGHPDSVTFSAYGTVDSAITLTVTINNPADTQCTVSGDTTGVLTGFTAYVDENKSYTFTFDTLSTEQPILSHNRRRDIWRAWRAFR